jgi:GBP family porin
MRWSWLFMNMKKVICSLLMIFSTSTNVQAQNALNLYGIIDIGVQYLSTRQNVSGVSESQQFFGIANGVQSGSRFGMRGFHDFGGGVESFFVLENGFNSGNGAAAQGGRMFGRQSTLSVRNNKIGQVDLGRQVNLATNYFLPIDPFGEGFGQANIGASFGSTNTVRYSNMLLFQAQPADGFTVGLGYSFATEMTGIYLGNGGCTVLSCQATNAGYQFRSGNNLRAITLGAKYIKGPLLLAVGYDQLQGPDNLPGGAPKPNPTAWVVGGLYNFEVVKVSVAYGQSRNGAWAGQPAGSGAATGGIISDSTLGAGAAFASGYGANSYFLGFNAPLGQGSALASLQRMQPVGSTLLSAEAAPQMIYSAGYIFNFTKRTNLYAYASYASNYAMVNSAQSTVIGVGLRHQF